MKLDAKKEDLELVHLTYDSISAFSCEIYIVAFRTMSTKPEQRPMG
jgi:hypothetical protein